MRNLDKRISNTYYTPNADSITQYLSDISKYNVLSDSEIKMLISESRKGNKTASDKIINSNQRFVFSLAKRFCNGDHELLSDLINEANIGLIMSIDKFDPNNDNKFLTYSVYWMQRQIFLYLTFTKPIVKVSNRAKTMKVPEIKDRFLKLNGRMPTTLEIIDELSDKYGIELPNESDVYQLTSTSIDSQMITENSDDFSSFLYDANEQGSGVDIVSHNLYSEHIENDYLKSIISNSIGVLTSKERMVVELLYGINDYREYAIQEVADKMGMSKEGVRVMNKRAINKLRNEISLKFETV